MQSPYAFCPGSFNSRRSGAHGRECRARVYILYDHFCTVRPIYSVYARTRHSLLWASNLRELTLPWQKERGGEASAASCSSGSGTEGSKVAALLRISFLLRFAMVVSAPEGPTPMGGSDAHAHIYCTANLKNGPTSSCLQNMGCKLNVPADGKFPRTFIYNIAGISITTPQMFWRSNS